MDERVAKPVFEFGRFRLDLGQRVLLSDGQIVQLTPKALSTLGVLVREAGRVVDKDALMQEIWPATFVEENSLARNISVLRRALGTQPSGLPFIETVAKRGYRLAAPVTQLIPQNGAPEEQPPSASAETRGDIALARLRLRHPLAVVAVAGALAIAFVFGQARRYESRAPAAAPATTAAQGDLAVLPLQVLTPTDASLRYLQIGIPDTIITRLAGIHSLRLRPTSAVLRFGSTSVDARRAGQELDVEHVLAGTLRAQAGGYRLNLQLVRVADGAAIWGRPYDIASGDLASLQDDSVAEQVARALSLQLTSAERERVHRRYTQNTAAYADFLRGRALQVEYTERRMREAIGQFEAALARDPAYALARASLAMALASYSVRYADESEAGRWGARAEEEATLALKQDPNLADAHLALGSAAGTVYRNFDWPRVLDETSVALSLDPNLHLAHTARARVFYHYGLFRGTAAEADAAKALAGESSVENQRTLFYALLFGGRFPEAFRLGEQLHQRTDAVAIPTHLALAAYYLGDTARAFSALRDARRGGSPDLRAQAVLASLEAAAGHRGTARTLVGKILEQPYRDHHIAYSLAATHAQLGEFDEAARWLTEAANTGFPCYPWFLRDPLLEPLRRSSQFRLLEPSMRRAHEARSSRYGVG